MHVFKFLVVHNMLIWLCLLYILTSFDNLDNNTPHLALSFYENGQITTNLLSSLCFVIDRKCM